MTWTLHLPYGKPPLLANTSNRGITHGARMGHAAKAKQVRGEVHQLARAAGIPALAAIHIRLHYRPRDRRRRDPDGLMATFKPCLDGIVDAGVVPDDTAQYVDWSRPAIHPPSLPDRTPALWLVITATPYLGGGMSLREGNDLTEIEACPVCGATGPCSLDDAGRPLVHTDAFNGVPE